MIYVAKQLGSIDNTKVLVKVFSTALEKQIVFCKEEFTNNVWSFHRFFLKGAIDIFSCQGSLELGQIFITALTNRK